MEYILGFDGGGTKSDCLICDRNGQILALEHFGGSNHENFAHGFSDLEPLILQMVCHTLQSAHLSAEQISYAVFGMAGCDLPSQKAELENILRKTGISRVTVCNDVFLGIPAALPTQTGCCLVNGTGNTIGGIDPKGTMLQIAGTGFMFGEEGGGDRIAEKVVRTVYDYLFRTGPCTALTEPVLQLFGISDDRFFVEKVRDYCAREGFPTKNLVMLLDKCAFEGDAVCISFLKQLSHEFACSLAGCIQRLDFGSRVDIALVGSVTLKAKCPIMLDALKEELPLLTHKTHSFYPLRHPPVLGAVRMAASKAWNEVGFTVNGWEDVP